MTIALIVAGVVLALFAIALFAAGMILGANSALSCDSRKESVSNVFFVVSIFCFAASCYCLYIAGTMAGAQ